MQTQTEYISNIVIEYVERKGYKTINTAVDSMLSYSDLKEIVSIMLKGDLPSRSNANARDKCMKMLKQCMKRNPKLNGNVRYQTKNPGTLISRRAKKDIKPGFYDEHLGELCKMIHERNEIIKRTMWLSRQYKSKLSCEELYSVNPILTPKYWQRMSDEERADTVKTLKTKYDESALEWKTHVSDNYARRRQLTVLTNSTQDQYTSTIRSLRVRGENNAGRYISEAEISVIAMNYIAEKALLG